MDLLHGPAIWGGQPSLHLAVVAELVDAQR